MKSVFTFAAPACALLALTAGPALAQSCPDQLEYCTTSPNSVGDGALITWTGTPNPAADDFHLVTTGGPANRPLLFYYGAAQEAIPFGNGMRCVGAGGLGLFRLPPVQLNAFGAVIMKVDFTQAPVGAGPGMWSLGDTWYCQGWYRDPAGGGGAFQLDRRARSQCLRGYWCV